MSNNALVQAAQNTGLLAMMDNLADAASRLMDDTGTSAGTYLQFSGKTGQYTLNGQPLDEGTQLAAHFFKMRKGIVCWRDSKPIDRQMIDVLGTAPMPEFPPLDARERGDQWQNVVEVPVKTLDTGEQAVFGLSTQSGVAALSRLFTEFATKVRMQLDPAGNPKIAIIEIGADKKSGKDDEGKTYYYFKPILKIVDWIGEAELNATFAGDDTAQVEDEVVEPEPVKAAPARPVAGTRPGIRR